MEDLDAFEPVVFLRASVRLCVPSAVIGESKEVSLTRESDKVDRAQQVHLYELIRMLGLLL